MKRVIRPFWSYNIIKIEKWLENMATRGYILKKVNTITRTFTFEKQEPKNLNYKICYENKGINDVSPSLKKEGWKVIANIHRWLFVCNEKSREEIKINPSREILLKRNKIIKNIMLMIVMIYGFIYVPLLLILGFAFTGAALGLIPVEHDNSIVEISSEPFLLDYLGQNIIFVALLFGIYTIIKLNKLDKQIRQEDNLQEIKVEENNCLEKSKAIRKIKLGWFYSPDKTEKWLESMEMQGYNLQKIHKLGTIFYFKKGNPRKIKYIADYKNSTNETYYEIHKEDGWKLNFKSMGGFMQWSIWSKEYEGVEPEIYTDGKDLLAYARKILIVHTLMFAPILVIYPYIIGVNIAYNDNYLFSFPAIVSVLCLVEFGIFYKNIVGYYLRTKKKVSNSAL